MRVDQISFTTFNDFDCLKLKQVLRDTAGQVHTLAFVFGFLWQTSSIAHSWAGEQFLRKLQATISPFCTAMFRRTHTHIQRVHFYCTYLDSDASFVIFSLYTGLLHLHRSLFGPRIHPSVKATHLPVINISKSRDTCMATAVHVHNTRHLRKFWQAGGDKCVAIVSRFIDSDYRHWLITRNTM